MTTKATARKSRLHVYLPSPEKAFTGHGKATHLEDFREEMIAKATAARKAYDDATLARWYEVQLADVRQRVADLEGKVARNLERLTDPESPHWPRYWAQQAQYAYLAQTAEHVHFGRGTLPLLEAAGHVLVCPEHGLDGDDFAELAVEHREGLSLLGVLEGGLETHSSWQRHCAGICAREPLRLLAEHFQREWEQTSGQAARARGAA